MTFPGGAAARTRTREHNVACCQRMGKQQNVRLSRKDSLRNGNDEIPLERLLVAHSSVDSAARQFLDKPGGELSDRHGVLRSPANARFSRRGERSEPRTVATGS